jgi:hypothetical protein
VTDSSDGQSSLSDAPASGLASLKRMSATAGASAGEYRPINPLAVAGATAALLSPSIWIHPAFALFAIVGLLVAAAALVQIRRSHGTQGGMLLAILSLVVCTAVLAFWGTRQVAATAQTADATQEVRQTVDAFGEILASGDFDQAYEQTSPIFQEEIARERFIAVVSSYVTVRNRNDERIYGDYTHATISDRVVVGPGPGGRRQAETEMIVHFETGDPLPQVVLLRETEGGWVFRRFDFWFPEP